MSQNNLFFAILFYVGFIFSACAQDLNPVVQATSFDNSRPYEKITRYFASELAKALHGDKKTINSEQSESFDVFFRNFKYKPDTLIKKIPLSPTPNIQKVIRASLKSLIPYFKKSFHNKKTGEYFLHCDTIRGPVVITCTLTPFKKVVHLEKVKKYFVTILSREEFSLNVLLERRDFDDIQKNEAFRKTLINHLDIDKNKPYFFPKELQGSPFLEIIPSKSYDVSSITNEIQFYDSNTTNLREVYFYALPLAQYSLSPKSNNAREFFFWQKNKHVLRNCVSILEGIAEGRGSVLWEQLEIYISALKKNSLGKHTFKEQIQKFFNTRQYSINYDAIARNKEQIVYENLRTYILSQGIYSFKQLGENTEIIDSLIEKFFVLGTTYFYRSWSRIQEFVEIAKNSYLFSKDENRPLKLKVYACSTGEEVLTFAFHLLENGIENFRILGSDINPKFIESAKKMIYSRGNFERLPDALRNRILKKYFIQEGEIYKIKDKAFFQKRIKYRVIDITKDLPSDLETDFLPGYDLISCQNIFLYLNPNAVVSLYRKLFLKLNDFGQLILVDKFYNHRALTSQLSGHKFLAVNESIIQRFPHEVEWSEIAGILKNRIKESGDFSCILQYGDIADLDSDKKRKWYRQLLKKPGNKVFLYNLAGENLIQLALYQEAAGLLEGAIYESPYFRNTYELLGSAYHGLKQRKKKDYVGLLEKATRILRQGKGIESLEKALRLYKGALRLDSKELVGYYSLAYQLLRKAIELKSSGAYLVEYEKYLNQAFKNFNYVRKESGGNIFSLRGIAEIALILSKSYGDAGNKEIESRLIYNAIVNYERKTIESTNFTVLYFLAQLRTRMGRYYFESHQHELSLKELNKAIQVYEKASKSLTNYKDSLIYRYYVDYAETYIHLAHLCKIGLGGNLKTEYCLKKARELIDISLIYNSVYGLEAIELRSQIHEMSKSLKQEFHQTFSLQ